ncbi:hypothetical protein [Glutamicibacter sp.]
MNWDLPPAGCTTCRRRIIDWEVDDSAAFCVPAIGKILPGLAAG